MQPKLAIGPVDDPLEREADAIADRVMRMPEPAQSRANATLQRKCAACEEEEHSGTVHPKHHGVRGSAGTEALTPVNELLQSPGKPLGPSSRAFFEPRFGRDFSRVRVHVDERAARSAQSVGALAYTVGPHIAFAAGQFAPGSDHGRHLLAHELVHTIQQGHSNIRRCPSATQQGVAGLVTKPEEFGNEEAAAPIEVADLSQETIQRSATWKGATVHEDVNAAEMPFEHDASPITWQLLNGTKLETIQDAEDAINVPAVMTSGSGTKWTAKVELGAGSGGQRRRDRSQPGAMVKGRNEGPGWSRNWINQVFW